MFKNVLNALGVFFILFILGILYNFISPEPINWGMIFGFSVLCTVVFLAVDRFKK
ncbi:hypothetical protein [Staphylococcus haemolyticus]|uniref:hypothetical protein n=1 Tax=Staphylococcus haemolyticus TaxID=1283 RepID=UPI00159F65AF|nr:hypothetical protein [Staphylococcus haemolyticus]MCH4444588.1 hypothetical protein [Staphylococcus haemolyticus]